MENELTRAQHYRHLAASMLKSAREEAFPRNQRQFLDLASQYEHLADRLITRRSFPQNCDEVCVSWKIQNGP
jgi:hypothetical protein